MLHSFRRSSMVSLGCFEYVQHSLLVLSLDEVVANCGSVSRHHVLYSLFTYLSFQRLERGEGRLIKLTRCNGHTGRKHARRSPLVTKSDTADSSSEILDAMLPILMSVTGVLNCCGVRHETPIYQSFAQGDVGKLTFICFVADMRLPPIFGILGSKQVRKSSARSWCWTPITIICLSARHSISGLPERTMATSVKPDLGEHHLSATLCQIQRGE